MIRPIPLLEPATGPPIARRRPNQPAGAPRPLALLLGLALAALTACERDTDSLERVYEDRIATKQQLVEVLRGVRDEETAKQAIPRLRQLSERMERIRTRQILLPPPSPARDEQLKAQYAEPLWDVQARFRAEHARIIADPRMGRHVVAAMQTDTTPPSP